MRPVIESLKAFALLRQGKINLHLVRVGHPLALQVDLSFIGYQFLRDGFTMSMVPLVFMP